jgi:hypothetical protein
MGHDLGMKSRVHPKYKTKYRVANWADYEHVSVLNIGPPRNRWTFSPLDLSHPTAHGTLISSRESVRVSSERSRRISPRCQLPSRSYRRFFAALSPSSADQRSGSSACDCVAATSDRPFQCHDQSDGSVGHPTTPRSVPQRFRTALPDAPDGRPVEVRPSFDAKLAGLPRAGGLHHRYVWQEAA